MAATREHLIAGRPKAAERTFESREPASPDRVVGAFANGDAAAVARAVDVARGAGEAWAATSIIARGEIVRRAGAEMRQHAAELGALVAREVGKPIAEATAEIQRAAVTCDYVAGQARLPQGEVYASDGPAAHALSIRRPVGVVAIVTPWNFPVGLPLWKLAPALLYGNTVVWKASEQAPACAAALHGVWTDAGVPPEVLGLVFGDGEAGAALIEHEGIDAISFTGSTATGRRIGAAAAARGVPAQLELGGKNAVVVLEDADLEATTRLIVAGATSFGGQKCSATSRVIAVEGIYDQLGDRLRQAFDELVVGDPLASETDVGPLIDAAAVDRAQRYAEEAVAAGATLLCGGERPDAAGHFVRPALLGNVDPGSALATEEVFGPVLALIRAADAEAAVEIANATEYGFFTSICGSRLEAMLEFAPRIESGIVKFNAVTTAADPHLPFGGWKSSGNSAPEQGLVARYFFTRLQTVYVG